MGHGRLPGPGVRDEPRRGSRDFRRAGATATIAAPCRRATRRRDGSRGGPVTGDAVAVQHRSQLRCKRRPRRGNLALSIARQCAGRHGRGPCDCAVRARRRDVELRARAARDNQVRLDSRTRFGRRACLPARSIGETQRRTARRRRRRRQHRWPRAAPCHRGRPAW